MGKSEHVKKWRRETKKRMVEAMGGTCQICGYNRCHRAMDFHHIYGKDFAMGGMRASPKAWSKIIIELRKCVLLCNRCHQEVHEGLTEVPSDVKKFNEYYADYKSLKRKELMDECPICGKEKPKKNITCSLSCASKKRGKVDWENIDLDEIISNTKTWVERGILLGISDVAVKKRAKKLGLI